LPHQRARPRPSLPDLQYLLGLVRTQGRHDPPISKVSRALINRATPTFSLRSPTPRTLRRDRMLTAERLEQLKSAAEHFLDRGNIDNGDCWNCGGEGYTFDCFDGCCEDADVGCDDCTRRC